VFQGASVGTEVVVGYEGVRVTPLERSRRPRSSASCERGLGEKPKKVLIGAIAAEMKNIRDEGGRIAVVAGPAVVHTGASRYCLG